MPQDSRDKIEADFEARMEKRRRMFEITGVDLHEYSNAKGKNTAYEKSVSNCFFCTDEKLCSAWLEQNTGSQDPPEFCPNHDLIQSFQDKYKNNPFTYLL